jgi:hypothetical protein
MVPARSDLLRVDREWALALAIRAVADFHFLRGVLIEWTQDAVTLSAVEFDILQLGEYPGPSGHDARHADQVIQVARTEVA